MRRTLFNLTIALLISGIIITALPGQIALAATHIVAKDGSGDFTIIQNAINFASSGDTITVKEGTYNEWLTIDKPLTLQGEDKDTTILEPDEQHLWSTLDDVGTQTDRGLSADAPRNTLAPYSLAIEHGGQALGVGPGVTLPGGHRPATRRYSRTTSTCRALRCGSATYATHNAAHDRVERGVGISRGCG